ncbi:MAG: hybrid sensor histidine kinase/response regulator, partial [Planctomycetota bacterium]
LVADAVLVCDGQLRLVRMNQAAVSMLGWSRKRGLGQALERVLHLLRADDRSDLRLGLDTPELAEPDRAAIVVTPQGQERRVQVRLAQLQDTAGTATGMLVIIRDETARLLIEEQFRRSQKMESVGRLVSGIAHDFNNLLCGMTGYADLLRRKLGTDDARRSYADAILDAAGRAGDLTQRILDTARQRDDGMRQVHIHKVISDVIGMIRHTLGPDIHVQSALRADPDTVLGDFSQLQSALLNLVINARDAMPEGGELRLSTALLAADEDAQPDRQRLAITIADNGQGMPAAVRERIFEPFFTTKEAGRGTGLGLAAVQSIVHEHRGAIRVSSEPGVGTTITMLLPLQSEPQPAIDAQREQETTRLGRGELILLADDEDILRRMGEDILGNLGYKVLIAANGAEAVALYRRHRPAIKLVLLDVVMPQMNGTTARKQIRAMDPEVPIIMCSGCSGEQSFAAYGDRKPSPFLAKPFSAEALGRAVATQLAGA